MSTKRKLPQKLPQPVIKPSAKPLGKLSLDQSKATVTAGGAATKRLSNGTKEDIVSISSDSSSEQQGESESEDESADENDAAPKAEEKDVTMADVNANGQVEEEEEADTGPSFGELVQANPSNEVIDVANAFNDPSTPALPQTQIIAPSGASLGTVLTQALRTNDTDLLESCLHTTDISTIRLTIQRLESPLAGILLHKLADRLHIRPGRAGSLMVWVQWALVTHGGYLATQRDLIGKLADVTMVLERRSRGLQILLSVKGKVDMLEAQCELRRSMQNQRRGGEEDEDDEGVVYVEGEESEDDDQQVSKPQMLARNGDLVDFEEETEEDDDMPNGVVADSEEEEEESSEDDAGMLDDEAEETDADTGDEEEADLDDADSMEEEDSDDGVPPVKIQRTGSSFSKKR